MCGRGSSGYHATEHDARSSRRGVHPQLAFAIAIISVVEGCGGPAGFHHLPKVAVPQKRVVPCFNSRRTGRGMSVSVGKAKRLLTDANVGAWYSNLFEGSEKPAHAPG